MNANEMPVLMSTTGSPHTHCPQLNVFFASFKLLSGFRELLIDISELNLLRFRLLLCQACARLPAPRQGSETQVPAPWLARGSRKQALGCLGRERTATVHATTCHLLRKRCSHRNSRRGFREPEQCVERTLLHPTEGSRR